MSPVGRPVHCVNLGKMALQRPLGLHKLVLGDGFMGLLGHSAHWKVARSVSVF